MRVTIVGSGTSAPQPETAASGILVEGDSTAILVDCGQGVIRELMANRDPRQLDAIIIGHLHADHYVDIVSLRYLLPWDGFAGRRIPIFVPPGGIPRLTELAAAISERPDFFDHTFEIIEYDPSTEMRVGDLTVEFLAGRHYVPAWGCSIRDQSGHRAVISGDTGPNEPLVEASRGADVFIVEATVLDAGEDDPTRGHLTLDEAIDMGTRAGAGRTILVHFRTQNRAAILKACAGRDDVEMGVPGLVVELPRGPATVAGAAAQQAEGRWADDQDGTAPGRGIASSASRARRR